MSKFIISGEKPEKIEGKKALELATEADSKKVFQILAPTDAEISLTGEFSTRAWANGEKNGELLFAVGTFNKREVSVPITSFISKTVRGVEGETLCESVYPENTPRVDIVNDIINGKLTTIKVGTMLVKYDWGETSRQYLTEVKTKKGKSK